MDEEEIVEEELPKIEMGSIQVHLDRKDYAKIFGVVLGANMVAYFIKVGMIAISEQREANVETS